MLIQTRPPDHASLAVPVCNPTPDGKTSETPHFGFAVLPRQLGSGYSSLEHFNRQELLSSLSLAHQRTCRLGLSLSSDNGVKLHRAEDPRRKQRRVRLVRPHVRKRIFRRQAWLLIADQPVHPRIGHLEGGLLFKPVDAPHPDAAPT